MVALTYQIKPAQKVGFETQTRCLVIEAGISNLTVLLWDNTKNMPEAAEVFNGITNWDDQWEEMLHQSELLNYRNLTTKVFFNTPRFIPVPAVFFTPINASEQIAVIFGEGMHQHSGADLLPGFDMVMAWETPLEIFECLTTHFEMVQFQCLGTLILKSAHTKEEEAIGNIIVSGEQIWIAAWRNHKLLLVKTICLEGPDDLCYELLNICRQWGIPNEKMHWEISGMVNKDSPLWIAPDRFFENFAPSEGGFADSEKIPGHYFAYLCNYLKLDKF
jgi:hypothetical protein